MLEVELKSLFCKKVHGNRIAREGINHQEIESLRGFALQHKAGITQLDDRNARTVSQEGKFSFCNFDNQWIHFIESKLIAFPAITGQDSGAQADDALRQRRVFPQI